ncbi:hypothetical protein MNBD_GAMMA22-2249 [hydrothermal vent metagenome]|uniref:Lipoprotein n=1 Tax=hydrothermal vent metagenome TaxID=652676 RepID=A0A3B1AB10_9ZZZZ
MDNILARSLIAIFIITVSACSTLSIPDWVENNSQYYTTKDFLLGHGIAQSHAIAKESAARQITLQFKAVTASGELRSQANIVFNQIEYEEPWLNTNSKQHHVLAYISRSKVATFIQNKMLALDELTYEFFEQAKSSTDLLEQTSYVNSAINAQIRRNKLKPVLKIITNNTDIPTSYNIDRLSKVLTQLQKRINLLITISRDSLGNLNVIMKRSLDVAGFIRNEKLPSKNHLLLTLKTEESSASGSLSLKGKLTAVLEHKHDENNKTIRGKYQWTFNATASNRGTLIQKSRETLTAQINTNLKQVIMDMMMVEYDHEEDIPDQDFRDFDMPEFNAPFSSEPEEDKTKTQAAPLKIRRTPSGQIKQQPQKNAAPIANSEQRSKPNSISDIEDPVSTLPPLTK